MTISMMRMLILPSLIHRVPKIVPDCGRVISFTSAGGAKPGAGRGGLEGFTPPHHQRRGQRLSTDNMPPPAPRAAPGSGLR